MQLVNIFKLCIPKIFYKSCFLNYVDPSLRFTYNFCKIALLLLSKTQLKHILTYVGFNTIKITLHLPTARKCVHIVNWDVQKILSVHNVVKLRCIPLSFMSLIRNGRDSFRWHSLIRKKSQNWNWYLAICLYWIIFLIISSTGFPDIKQYK